MKNNWVVQEVKGGYIVHAETNACVNFIDKGKAEHVCKIFNEQGISPYSHILNELAAQYLNERENNAPQAT